ncbi:MAG: hypothetical protein II165_07960, partial [Bacteroidales bacterium]|nr:hypothetical protein [Bacteroidales bacterium]
GRIEVRAIQDEEDPVVPDTSGPGLPDTGFDGRDIVANAKKTNLMITSVIAGAVSIVFGVLVKVFYHNVEKRGKGKTNIVIFWKELK